MKIRIAIIAAVLVGCGGVYEQPCRFIPDENREKAAEFIQSCVNGATAKNTGENQAAHKFVDACSRTADQVYGVDGFQRRENDAGGWAAKTGCRIIKGDSHDE